MREIKVVHCGDTHLGFSYQFLEEKGRIMRQELNQAFFRMVDYCESEEMDFLLIAGDLFESPSGDLSLVKELCEAFQRLSHTKVIITPGNHDFYWRNSPYEMEGVWPENVYIFRESGSFLFPEDKVCIVGEGFSQSYVEESQIEKVQIPELEGGRDQWTVLGVFHGDLVSKEQGSHYHPITKEDILRSGFDYLALGHIHKRNEMETVGRTTYGYSGSLVGLGYDEVGEKGFLSGRIRGKENQFTFVSSQSRKFLSYRIDIDTLPEEESSCQALAQYLIHYLKEQVGEEYYKHSYQIVLQGERSKILDFNLDRLLDFWRSELFYCRLKDETRLDQEIFQIAQENSFQGIFVKKALGEMENCQDKVRYQRVMKLGLKAFQGEVNYHDN